MNALHFVQADLVDFFRRQVGGRRAFNHEGIPGLALRQVPHAMRLPRIRDVGFHQVIAQLHVGRDDAVHDRFAVFIANGRSILFADVFRHVGHRLPEQRFLDSFDDLRIKLWHDAFHQDLRLHHTLLDAFVHVDDGLVHPLHEALATAEEVTVILRGVERMHATAGAKLREEIRRGIELVQRDQVTRELRPLDGTLEVADEDLVAEQVLAFQEVLVDLLHAGQEALVDLQALGLEFRRNAHGEPVVVAIVTDGGGKDRAALELDFEILIEDRIELLHRFYLALGFRLRRLLLGRCGCGTCLFGRVATGCQRKWRQQEKE